MHTQRNAGPEQTKRKIMLGMRPAVYLHIGRGFGLLGGANEHTFVNYDCVHFPPSVNDEHGEHSV